MFRMQCMGTKKDGSRCGSMVNHNGWNIDDAGDIYCHNHLNQGYFRSPEAKANMELELEEILSFQKKMLLGAAVFIFLVLYSSPTIGFGPSCGLLFCGLFAINFIIIGAMMPNQTQ